MKITKQQLRRLIREELSLNETDDDKAAPWGRREDGTPEHHMQKGTHSKAWVWDADDNSADSAEEAGMAKHLADNKVQLKLKAAMDVLNSSFPILDALYRHGLGNMSQPEEQEILARHLAAASAEVMANKRWNKPKN
jgi:hypothetical protein